RFLLRIDVPNVAYNADDSAERIIYIGAKTFADRIFIGPITAREALADNNLERLVTTISIGKLLALLARNTHRAEVVLCGNVRFGRRARLVYRVVSFDRDLRGPVAAGTGRAFGRRRANNARHGAHALQ